MTSPKKRRIDKIMKSMDQSSAMTHYVTTRVKEFAKMTDYARAIRDGRPTRWTVIGQVMEAAKAAMKRDGIVGQALCDRTNKVGAEALFLVLLADAANTTIFSEASESALQSSLLALQMKDILEADAFSNQAQSAVWHLAKTAYPLSPDMADAIRVNQASIPISDNGLKERIADAVRQYHIGQGSGTLPAITYRTEVDIESLPASESSEEDAIDDNRPDYVGEFWPDEEDLLEAFEGDRERYEAFLTGEYRRGVTTVNNDDFDAMVESIFQVIKDADLQTATAFRTSEWSLSKSLDLIPLIDGEWIDRLAVELVEAVEAIEIQGYPYHIDHDPHDLAYIVHIAADDMTYASMTDIEAARETARQRMTSFTGDKKTIEGREFWRFEQYKEWSNQSTTVGEDGVGFFDRQFQGVKFSALAAWFDAYPDDDVAGCPVAILKKQVTPRLPLYVEIDDADELRRLLTDRIRMIGSLNQWIIPKAELEGEAYIRDRMNVFNRLDRAGIGLIADNRYRTQVADWRDRAMAYAITTYMAQEAVKIIESKYFGGQSILFDDAKEKQTNQAKAISDIIGFFNKTVAFRLDRFEGRQLMTGEKPSKEKRDEGFAIDLESVKRRAVLNVSHKVKDMVEVAKIEALRKFEFYTEANDRADQLPAIQSL